MGTIPMKEDAGQEIYTRDHGVVKVDKNSWQDGRYHIVLSPNGAYQHINGLPIKDEAEIHEAFGVDEEGNCPNEEAKQKCLNWFRNRHEQLANPPRPIGFHSDGYPMFADGSVPDFDDLYSFFKPGPILTAAIVALQQYNERKGTGVAPKELRKAAPPSAETVTEPSPKAAPAPKPLQRLKKVKGVRKDKTAKPKNTVIQKAAQAPPQG